MKKLISLAIFLGLVVQPGWATQQYYSVREFLAAFKMARKKYTHIQIRDASQGFKKVNVPASPQKAFDYLKQELPLFSDGDQSPIHKAKSTNQSRRAIMRIRSKLLKVVDRGALGRILPVEHRFEGASLYGGLIHETATPRVIGASLTMIEGAAKKGGYELSSTFAYYEERSEKSFIFSQKVSKDSSSKLPLEFYTDNIRKSPRPSFEMLVRRQSDRSKLIVGLTRRFKIFSGQLGWAALRMLELIKRIK